MITKNTASLSLGHVHARGGTKQLHNIGPNFEQLFASLGDN